MNKVYVYLLHHSLFASCFNKSVKNLHASVQPLGIPVLKIDSSCLFIVFNQRGPAVQASANKCSCTL